MSSEMTTLLAQDVRRAFHSQAKPPMTAMLVAQDFEEMTNALLLALGARGYAAVSKPLLAEVREFLDALPEEVENVGPLLERVDAALGRDV